MGSVEQTEERVLLTIALPTFNRAMTLPKALRSLLSGLRGESQNQTELLIADNCSDDSTPRIVESISRKNPWAPIRSVRHARNLGYDGNHIWAYTQARGRYIFFCSDRYLYSIDFDGVCRILRAHEPAVLTFSHLFRGLQHSGLSSSVENSDDAWLSRTLGATPQELHGTQYLLTKTAHIVSAGCLRRGIPAAAVSDAILYRNTSLNWLEVLRSFDGSYMAVVAALLEPYLDMERTVGVVQYPWHSAAFARIGYGEARHDNLAVARANVRLAQMFPFLGRPETIVKMHLSYLTRLLRRTRGGRTVNAKMLSRRAIMEFCEENNYELTWKERAALRLSDAPLPKEIWRLDEVAEIALLRLGRALRETRRARDSAKEFIHSRV